MEESQSTKMDIEAKKEFEIFWIKYIESTEKATNHPDVFNQLPLFLQDVIKGTAEWAFNSGRRKGYELAIRDITCVIKENDNE